MNEVECEHCGKSHNLGDRFCPITGQPLGEPEAPRGITRLYNPKGLASEGPAVEVRGTPVKTRTFWTLPRWGKGKAVPPHTTPLSPIRPDPHARTEIARLPGVRSIDRTRPPAAAPPTGSSSSSRTTSAQVVRESGGARPGEPSAPRAATGAGQRPGSARPTPAASTARPTRGTPVSESPPAPRLPPPPPPPLRSTGAPTRSSARLGISPLEPTAPSRAPATAATVARSASGMAPGGSRPISSERATPAAGRDERQHEKSLFHLLREALVLPLRQGPAPLLAGTIVFLPGLALFVGVMQLVPRRLAEEISARAMLAAFLLAFIAALTLGIFAATVSLAISDRLGGRRTPFHRYPLWLFSLPRPLLASIVVAAGLVALGVPFLVVPGVVLLGLFAFVPFVAVYDLEPPRAALRRALRMAGACPVRLGILCAIGLALGVGAHALGGVIVGRTPGLVRSIVGGVLVLLAAYLPVGATFLLYLDVKRAREGFGEQELQAALEAVRPAREPEPVAEAG